jgi:hypothetical protein
MDTGEWHQQERMFSGAVVAPRCPNPAISPILLRHNEFGELELFREKFFLAGTDQAVMVAFHAEPGSPSALVLSELKQAVLGRG